MVVECYRNISTRPNLKLVAKKIKKKINCVTTSIYTTSIF